ncbi:MAG: ATP-binding cassette domain-containing protein [Bacteroidota bacterium]
MLHSNYLNKLWKLVDLEKEEIGSVYFYAILSGITQLSVPIGIQAIIGFIMGASMVTSIYILILLVLLGVLIIGLLQINQMKIIEKIQQKIFTRYAFDFAEKLPRYDLFQTDHLYLPEKINRFFDTITIQKSLSKLLLDIPAASIQIVFGLILLSLYHPIFIIFGILLIFILYLILKLTSTKGIETSYEESNYKYKLVAWLQEMARVIQTFKFSQGTHLNLIHTDKYVSGYLKSRTAHFQVLLFQYKTLVAFKVLITTAMLSIGTYLLLNQKLNLGEFIAAEIVILSLIAAVEKLISSLEIVYDVITSLEKISTITDSPLEKEGNVKLESTTSGIQLEMKNLSFTYPDGNEVLKNISIVFPAHQITCISNMTGSGKTTLLKILSGNFTTYEGQLLVNNLNYSNYQLESIRSQTGFLMMHQDIFAASIFENISMGRKDISIEQITALANKLGIQNSINELKDGYNTILKPEGLKLTSSLIKHIKLLRAFINKPKLILLEEPWLGIDIQTKNKLIDYLFEIASTSTIIIASDDSEFAQKCHHQILLINGTAQLKSNN